MNTNIRPGASQRATRRADCVCAGRRGIHAPAFTLIELVLVIAVVAVLSGVGILRFAGALSGYRADAAAQRIAQDIALTQARARTSSQSHSITFSTAQSSYTISGETSIKNPALAYTVSLSADPYQAALAAVAFSPIASRLTFDGYGKPTGGGTVRLTVGTLTRTLTIDSTTGQVVVSN